jgi:hypothetical protein
LIPRHVRLRGHPTLDSRFRGNDILLAATLTISALVFQSEFDLPLPTSWAYLVGGAVLPLAMALGYWNQERHRPGSRD